MAQVGTDFGLLSPDSFRPIASLYRLEPCISATDPMRTTIALFAILSAACHAQATPSDESSAPVTVDAATEPPDVRIGAPMDSSLTTDSAWVDHAVATDSGAWRPNEDGSTDDAPEGDASDALPFIDSPTDSPTTCTVACLDAATELPDVTDGGPNDVARITDGADSDHLISAESGALREAGEASMDCASPPECTPGTGGCSTLDAVMTCNACGQWVDAGVCPGGSMYSCITTPAGGGGPACCGFYYEVDYWVCEP